MTFFCFVLIFFPLCRQTTPTGNDIYYGLVLKDCRFLYIGNACTRRQTIKIEQSFGCNILTYISIINLVSLMFFESPARLRHRAHVRTLRFRLACDRERPRGKYFTKSRIRSFFIGIFTESDRARP